MSFLLTTILYSWSGYLVLAWIFVALYFFVQQGWFKLSEPFGEFPFSIKQFILIAFQLFSAFLIFLFSFYIAHSLVSFFPVFRAYAFQERYVIEQVVGNVLATFGLYFFISLFSPELIALTVGQRGNWSKWCKGCLYGILFYPLISSMAWVVGFIVSWFFPEPRTPQAVLTLLKQFDHSSILFWMFSASIVLLVPYVEEVLFRGFLQSFLGGVFHPLLAVLGTAIIFSLFHYSSLQKSSNFEIMFGLFMFSLFVSRLRVKENSVISCVGMHAAFNATSLVLSFI